jgi:hypothetical protein
MRASDFSRQRELAEGASDGGKAAERPVAASQEAQHDGKHLARVSPIAPVGLRADGHLVAQHLC